MQTTPVVVSGLGGPAIAIGASQQGGHTCAVLASGAVECWGENDVGQLGDGTHVPSLSPVLVAQLGGVAKSVSPGFQSTCALLDTGKVRCWGNNYAGQLGNGTTINSDSPVDVTSLGGVATRITSGTAQACALLSTGAVRCWGDNSSGQLGNGATSSAQTTPVDVQLGGIAATEVAAGSKFSCARLVDGTVRCWGANDKGTLGDGTTNPSPVPVVVRGNP
jgi:alpha-tubulin suppressor-like RCC1 family protein